MKHFLAVKEHQYLLSSKPLQFFGKPTNDVTNNCRHLWTHPLRHRGVKEVKRRITFFCIRLVKANNLQI